AVAVGVFQDLDAVARFLPLGCPFGVLEALQHPEPAALVDGESNGVDDVRLGRKDLDLVPRRYLEPLHRFFGLEIRLARGPPIVEAVLLLSQCGADESSDSKSGKQAA